MQDTDSVIGEILDKQSKAANADARRLRTRIFHGIGVHQRLSASACCCRFEAKRRWIVVD
jgi:hypothetical protein